MQDRTKTRSVWRLLAGAAGIVLGGAAACGDPGLPGSGVLPPDEKPLPPVETPTGPLGVVPAISGGTLLVLRDNRTIVAADPDRDSVWLVDAVDKKVRKRVQLAAGTEPGRVIEDQDGKVHVALRRGGQVVKVDPQSGQILSSRSVCPAPRGLAFDAATDNLHVACSGGELTTIKARGGDQARTWFIESDLRDVVVKGTHLLVTRFRSSEILEVDENGALIGRGAPRKGSGLPDPMGRPTSSSPTTAWRMVPMPDGQVVLLHQRGLDSAVSTRQGGYGNGPCKDSGIVSSALSMFNGTEAGLGTTLAMIGLTVDVAVSRGGTKIAVIGPSSSGGRNMIEGPPVQILTPAELTGTDACKFPSSPSGPFDRTLQLIAGAFDGQDRLWLQSREPARLVLQATGEAIQLTGAEDRKDEGHRIFHSTTMGMIACASCHAEAGDDAHVWTFDPIGPRRTQSLRGGILSTAPFHWDGDMSDLSKLMRDVFMGRMTGEPLTEAQISAVGTWLDAQPLLPRRQPADPQAVARGKVLFNDAKVACASCHGGARFTNNQSVDVGTGKAFQVPSLIGVATRAPLMHTGCARTLRARFDVTCGGADRHGQTSHLSPSQIDDLVAYLETL
jgi:mono/diheme cytochrome c family protein